MLTKPGPELTLFDMLSRLSFPQATRFLGPEGGDLIAAGGKYDIDITTQVELERDRFRLVVDSATVTVALSPAARKLVSRSAWSVTSKGRRDSPSLCPANPRSRI